MKTRSLVVQNHRRPIGMTLVVLAGIMVFASDRTASPAELGAQARTPSIVVVRRRAEERIRQAFDLGSRGAAYSARTEFIKALELVAQALDADEGRTTHSEALEAGLRALHEAEDFVPRDAELNVRWDLTHLVASHRTPVLKSKDTHQISLTAALQIYYAYATELLAHSGGHEQTASIALYGWARVEAMSPGGSSQADPLCGAKAIALHHAALLVDEQNYLAANELGVLLARYGQMYEAKDVFDHSLAIAPRAETWRNLALVHQSLGDREAAEEAFRRGQALADVAATSGRNGMVRWVDVDTFVRDSGPEQLGELTTGTKAATNPTAAKAKPVASKASTQWTSWLKPKVLGDILAGPTRRTEPGNQPKP